MNNRLTINMFLILAAIASVFVACKKNPVDIAKDNSMCYPIGKIHNEGMDFVYESLHQVGILTSKSADSVLNNTRWSVDAFLAEEFASDLDAQAIAIYNSDSLMAYHSENYLAPLKTQLLTTEKQFAPKR